jgi:hypothetical protein
MISNSIKITNNLTAVWLIEFQNYRWATSNFLYNGSYYTGKIQNFSGISETVCKPQDNSIPDKNLNFCIPDENNIVNGQRGESVIVRLIIDDQQFLSWNFIVSTFSKYYDKAYFDCIDFFSYSIEDVDYPRTDLINPLDTSSSTHSGSENACIPIVYGNPYIPLRSLLVGSNRAYVLGEDDGSTYTIDSVSYPVEWDEKAEFLAANYTFTQSSYNGLRVFVPYIATGGTAGFFESSGSLLDMPTKFSKSTTSGITNPADIISNIIQDLGHTLSAIDTASFAYCENIYSTIGLSFNAGFYDKKSAKEVLCSVLSACNSTINIYDKIYLKYVGDASLATINRNDIADFSFSENVLKNINDAGIVEYYENVQAGDEKKRKQIYVPISGTTYSNASSDTFLIPYISDTVILQQLARIYFRKKYWYAGDVSFDIKKRYLKYECGDKITILDDLYESGDYYISSKNIGEDLSLKFSCERYLDDIGQIEDYEPDPQTIVEDTSDRLYYATQAYNTIGFVNAANCRIYGNSIKKISGASSWTSASAYSRDSKVDNSKISFKSSQTNCLLAVGLSIDPTINFNYTSINYCWMLKADGTCEAFSSGTSLGTFGSYTELSQFEIVYDGYKIIFYLDGDPKHTISGVSEGLRFYVDSSFYTLDGAINSVVFEAYGDVTQTAINNGVITSGYIGDKAIDDDPTLGIDFNNANIIVGGDGELSLSGSLTVNSGGGITVNDGGGITVNSGGDISLISSDTDPYDLSTIYFKHGASDTDPIKFEAYVSSGQKYLYIQTENDISKYLRIGSSGQRWKSVQINAQGFGAIVTDTAYKTTSMSLSEDYFISELREYYDSVEHRGYFNIVVAPEGDIVYTSVYNTKMVVLRAPIVCNYVPIMTSPGSTYDGLIPYNGHFYFYIDSSTDLPYIRFKDSTGTYITKAI